MASSPPLGTGGLLTVTALSAVGATGYGTLAPAMAELAAAYQVSEPAVGLLQGVIAVPGIALTVALGGLSDRLGRGRVALGCLLLFTVAGTACALVDSFGTAVALRAVQGIGFAGLLTIPPTVIGEALTGAARQRGLAVNTFVLTAASTVGPVAGGAVASLGDPRRAFWLYALGALLVPGTIRVLGLGPGRPATRGERSARLVADLRRAGALRTVVGALTLTTVVIGLMTAATAAMLPLALDRVFDVPLAGRGLLVGLSNVGSLAASAALAVLAGRTADRQAAQVGLGLCATALLLTAAAPAVWVVAVAVVLLGVGVGCAYNASVHAVSRQPVDGRGMLIGAWSASSRLGQATGPAVGAVLVGLVGPMAAFGVGGVAAAVAVVVLAVVGRRRR
ncbi:MFS transporter [Micromonospora cathayae]|uniref:MFS transporter n=1 Tax=Micromonospora cathayae TaxID=3028804 RepID=A0ABY7ZK00_9ACTN|nr:MFS transporter [Micromonospora sp. HUAS 3]WDZ83286.1 MFS transporter [Micromonospora sp. HUAS 3]